MHTSSFLSFFFQWTLYIFKSWCWKKLAFLKNKTIKVRKQSSYYYGVCACVCVYYENEGRATTQSLWAGRNSSFTLLVYSNTVAHVQGTLGGHHTDGSGQKGLCVHLEDEC